jgi:hypothetical protein
MIIVFEEYSPALITLAELKLFLKIDVSQTQDDTLLEFIINAVSAGFNTETSRTLKSVVYTDLLLDGNGENILSLPNYPVSLIAALTEDDIALTLNTDYYLYSSNFDAYLRKLYGGVWGLGSKNIKITMTAGYSTIPDDIKIEALKQAGADFQTQKGKTWGEQSRTFPDGSVSFQSQDLLPSVKRVLNRYARLGA